MLLNLKLKSNTSLEKPLTMMHSLRMHIQSLKNQMLNRYGFSFDDSLILNHAVVFGDLVWLNTSVDVGGQEEKILNLRRRLFDSFARPGMGLYFYPEFAMEPQMGEILDIENNLVAVRSKDKDHAVYFYDVVIPEIRVA